MNEKEIEKKLFAAVKKLGGIAQKQGPTNHSGKTDRLLIMPKGVTWFVEVKTTGKKLDPLQEVYRDELLKRGHNYAFIDDEKSLNELTKKLENGK
jgi:hypothetical protein